MPIGAIYSGVNELARHFSKSGEFTITPMGVKVENIWTAYGSGTAVSVPVSLIAVPNSFFVCALAYDGIINITNYTLGGVTTPILAGSAIPVGAILFGLVNPTPGAQNWTATLAAAVAWRAVCYQLSGVNQVSSVLNASSVNVQPGTSVTAPVSAAINGLLVDVISIANGTGGQGNNGQTVTKVNNIITSGYKSTVGGTETDNYSWSISQNAMLSVAAFNPV